LNSWDLAQINDEIGPVPFVVYNIEARTYDSARKAGNFWAILDQTTPTALRLHVLAPGYDHNPPSFVPGITRRSLGAADPTAEPLNLTVTGFRLMTDGTTMTAVTAQPIFVADEICMETMGFDARRLNNIRTPNNRYTFPGLRARVNSWSLSSPDALLAFLGNGQPIGTTADSLLAQAVAQSGVLYMNANGVIQFQSTRDITALTTLMASTITAAANPLPIILNVTGQPLNSSGVGFVPGLR